MTTLAVELAEAIKGKVEDLNFTEEVIVSRGYLPRFDATAKQRLQLWVVPKSEEQSPADRSRWRFDLQVDIGCFAKADDPADEEAIDAIMAEVETVKAGLKAAVNRNLTLASDSIASLVGIANAPIYDPEQLKANVFLSLITATYRVIV